MKSIRMKKKLYKLKLKKKRYTNEKSKQMKSIRIENSIE